MSQKVFTFTCSTFPPLIVTTSPGGGETDWLQNVVSVAVCSVPGRDNVSDGDGMVTAVDVALKILLALHHELRFSDAIRKYPSHASTCSIWQ